MMKVSAAEEPFGQGYFGGSRYSGRTSEDLPALFEVLLKVLSAGCLSVTNSIFYKLLTIATLLELFKRHFVVTPMRRLGLCACMPLPSVLSWQRRIFRGS